MSPKSKRVSIGVKLCRVQIAQIKRHAANFVKTGAIKLMGLHPTAVQPTFLRSRVFLSRCCEVLPSSVDISEDEPRTGRAQRQYGLMKVIAVPTMLS